jgi:hypothetical protein
MNHIIYKNIEINRVKLYKTLGGFYLCTSMYKYIIICIYIYIHIHTFVPPYPLIQYPRLMPPTPPPSKKKEN